jgi:hypothetical protein
MMAAVHPIEGAVVDRLHAVFDGDVERISRFDFAHCGPKLAISQFRRNCGYGRRLVPMCKFCDQVQHIVRDAIRPRTDDEADDLWMGECFFINASQFFDWSIGVRSRLEVR